MSSRRGRRPALLVFADSLAYYGPTGGLPADDPRIWPNIVASQLDWDLELIGRIGWTVGMSGGRQPRIRALGRRYPGPER